MLFFPLTVCGNNLLSVDDVRDDLQELARSYAGEAEPFVYSERRLGDLIDCWQGEDRFGGGRGIFRAILKCLFDESISVRAQWRSNLRVFNADASARLRENLEAAKAANEACFTRAVAASRAVEEAIAEDGSLVLGPGVTTLPSETVEPLFKAARGLFMSNGCVVSLRRVCDSGSPSPASELTYPCCVIKVVEAYRRILLAADRAYRRLHDPNEMDCLGCASVAEAAELWRMSAGNDAARKIGLLLQDVARATFDLSGEARRACAPRERNGSYLSQAILATFGCSDDGLYIKKRTLPEGVGDPDEYHSWVLDESRTLSFEMNWDKEKGFHYEAYGLNKQGFFGHSGDLHEWVAESSIAAQRVATWAMGMTDCGSGTCRLGDVWPGASFLGSECPEDFEFARALAAGGEPTLPPLDGQERVRVRDDRVAIPKDFLDGCDTAYVRVEAAEEGTGTGVGEGAGTGARLVCRSRKRAAAQFAKAVLADASGVSLASLLSECSFGKILLNADTLHCDAVENPVSELALVPGDEVLVEGHGDFFTIERVE